MIDAFLYLLPLGLVAAAFLIPLKQQSEADPLAPIKAQLAQVETDVARGLIEPQDAETNRLEIKRRLLRAAAEQEAAPMKQVGKIPAWLSSVALGVIAVSAGLMYRQLGMPGLPATENVIVERTKEQLVAGGPTYAEALSILKARLMAAPNDVTALGHFGNAAFNVGLYAEAADAYTRIANLDTSQRSMATFRRFQAMLALTAGQISPAGKLVLDEFTNLEPDDPLAAYYAGVYQIQQNDRAQAFETWLALAERSRPGDWYMPQIVAALAEMSPDNPRVQALTASAAPAVAPKLTAEQLAMADNMSDADQQQLINSMLGRLEDRLAENPKDAAGWERLAQARIRLGEYDKARKALEDGMTHVSAIEKVRLKVILDNLPPAPDVK